MSSESAATYEAERQIAQSLCLYCESVDNAEFDAFAAIFEHGQWFMVSAPGSAPVREWLEAHVRLYDGRTYMRHEFANLRTESCGPDEVKFSCLMTIWQDLPGEAPNLLVHARHTGTFIRIDRDWRWRTHEVSEDYRGDLSGHLRDLASI